MAEGSVHHPARQRRRQERGSATVTTAVSGEHTDVTPLMLCLSFLSTKIKSSSGAPDLTSAVFPPPVCQAWVECCQRLLPLIIHSILLDDSNGSWRESLSSHIQDFFGFCCRSAQAASRSATPLNSDSGKFESVTQSDDDLSGFLTGNDDVTFRSLFVILSESDPASQGLYDKTSLRTMLAVIDYLRHQRRPLAADRFALFLTLKFLFRPALHLICSCYGRLHVFINVGAWKRMNTVSFLRQLLRHRV